MTKFKKLIAVGLAVLIMGAISVTAIAAAADDAAAEVSTEETANVACDGTGAGRFGQRKGAGYGAGDRDGLCDGSGITAEGENARGARVRDGSGGGRGNCGGTGVCVNP